MKDSRYLLDKNIEIRYTPNDTSINYKDNTNTNLTSINPSTKNKNNMNYFFPSYNNRQFKEEKNSNNTKKLNSKYSTCYNYYPRKNYSKYLNYHQATNYSSITKNTHNQNTTFDDIGGYNKLNTKDLIEITKKRQEIITRQKLQEIEKKKNIENNFENIDLILNEDINNLSKKNNKKLYCDEGVQTSLINNEQLDTKKEDQVSTIIFTDKSALINQEITFLSIQYSINKNNNKENSKNDSETSKDYKNTENNDFVNVEYENKENINDNKTKEKSKNVIENNNINNNFEQKDRKESTDIISNKKQEMTELKNKNNDSNISVKCDEDNFQNDLEFTIVNNTQSSQSEENNDNNYMTNGQETFKIELNEQKQDNKNNLEDENFIINNNTNKHPRVFNDSLEDSNDFNNKNNIEQNKSKSSLNTEENEITEVEEFDQNLIFLQNQSKTMSSHFENINNISNEGKEENIIKNKNILIEDKSNNNNNEEINLDSLNDSLSLKKNSENLFCDNFDIKKNIFRIKGKKNNSLNKYQNYPNLRNWNINENNSLKSKLYNKNNLTNNERYQNNKNYDAKDNECYDLLKYKKSDLTINNKEKYIVIDTRKNSGSDSKEYDSKKNNISYNAKKNNIQNMKVFSHKKLNITTNENSKINISGIPINPYPSKNIINNMNNQNNYHKNNNDINHDNYKNLIIKDDYINRSKNYLITPRCMKKKRQLNNYADYYKLKISMSKEISNNYTNNNINNNNEYISNKNYKSLGHQKSYENWKNKK